MAAATGLTNDEFEQLPEALALNHELVDGKLVDVSGNTPVHIALRIFLLGLLGPYVRDHRLGEIMEELEVQLRRQCSWSGYQLHRSSKSPPA